jgi:uncharacterized protein YfcZ (UPF0381/DUF406 family)
MFAEVIINDKNFETATYPGMDSGAPTDASSDSNHFISLVRREFNPQVMLSEGESVAEGVESTPAGIPKRVLDVERHAIW